MTNSTRVLKNTLSLYFRMIALTTISLFTVRIVLNTLGATDYGLYNVVGGFVSMFSFISGALSVATQRFFAYHLADDNWNNVNKYFSVNLFIYLIFSIIILVVAESIGLWFVTHKLILPQARLGSAIIVYEISIFTFIVGLFISPFLALLIADENLSIYSFVSIIEGCFKVLIVYLLYILKGDKLVIYSILLAVVSLIINSVYVSYCLIKYRKLKLTFIKDFNSYKEVFSFLNWNMIGAFATVCKGQGINIIINLFFGTVVNAARGIAFQINNVITSFSANFMKAIDPQITKTYAIGNKEKFFNIVCVASKTAYFLLFIISLPLINNMNFILSLWLKNVPEYTVTFAKLCLIDALILTISDPFSTAVQATGKVKKYQLCVSVWTLLNMPLTYILLKVSQNPYIPFIVAIILNVFITMSRIIIVRILINFPIRHYFIKVIIRLFIETLLCIFFTLFISKFILTNSILFLSAKVLICEFFYLLSAYFIVLNVNEKKLILNKLKEKKIKSQNRN